MYGLIIDNDFVICECCKKEFKQITATHLRKEHGITFEEYKKMFPDSKTLAISSRTKISVNAKELNESGKIGFQNGHKVNLGKTPWNKGTHGLQSPIWSKGLTKETSPKLAESARKISETRRKMIAEGKQKKFFGKDNPMYGKKLTEKHKRALWGGWKASKTRPELKVNSFINGYDGWHYVGNGKFFIKTKVKTRIPDFVNIEKRKIIEVYGDYWHRGENPQDKINEYKDVGWDCIVLWEHEVMSYDFSIESIKYFL